jgi:LPXTG-motif cell wall-anchored protein
MKLKILIIAIVIAFFLLVFEGLNLFEMMKRFRFTDGMPNTFYLNSGYESHIKLEKEITGMKMYVIITFFILIALIIIFLLIYSKKRRNVALDK